MTRYVALLRGVNVGGKHRVDMRDLTRLLASMGFVEPATYINSGNVVLSADDRLAADAATHIEALLAGEFGVPARVLIRSATEMAKVAARWPFDGETLEPSRLMVTFLWAPPTAARVAGLQVPPGEAVRYKVVGSEIYAAYPDGLGRTRFTLPLIERALGVVGTTRNWNTVVKLAAMSANG